MKKSKKICFVITQAEMGGAQVYVRDLMVHAKQSGHEVTLAHGEQEHDWLDTEAEQQNIQTHYLQHLKRNISPANDVRALFEMYNFFKQQKFDTIFLNSSKAGIIGILAARLTGCTNILFNSHGWAYDDPRPFWERWVYIAAYFLTTPLTKKLICVSEYARKTGMQHGLSSKKLITIHNGIHTAALDYLQRDTARDFFITKYQVPADATILATIANFYPTKGLIYLLEAARLFQQKNTNAVVCIMGFGRDEPILREYIQQHNLEDYVKLITNLKPAYPYLSGCDVFVLPSVREGFPYALLEAMCIGLPIVATRVGGNPEVLSYYPDSHYTLVPSRKSAELAHALRNHFETAHLTSDQVQAVHSKVDNSHMIEKTEELY